MALELQFPGNTKVRTDKMDMKGDTDILPNKGTQIAFPGIKFNL
jgi:hypothetical protein